MLEAFKLDPEALSRLIQARTACNPAIDDSDIITGQDLAGCPTLGVMGLINTIIDRVDGGNIKVAAIYDKAGSGQTLTGFAARHVPEFVPAPEGASER